MAQNQSSGEETRLFFSPFIPFAENEEIFYIAYVSEQNLLIDKENGPANHPEIKKIFSHFDGECYIPHERAKN